MIKLICFGLLVSSAALADGIRWIGYSDIHYTGVWSWNHGDNQSISNEVRFHLTNHAPNFFVIAGDICESRVFRGTCVTNQYPSFTNDMSVVNVPYYPCPGNHDAPNNGNLSCWTNYFAAHDSWTNGNYVFIRVVTHIAGSVGNPETFIGIADSELDYLESTITNARPTYTNFIVMAHHGVVHETVFGSVASGYGLERLTNILNTYSVILWMHGHNHSIDASTDVIPNTTTLQILIPSLTRYLPGRGGYQMFSLTNSTLISQRLRTDTHGVVSSKTYTVPQYVSNWPPAPTYDIGIRSNVFGFRVSGPTNASVIIEASTSLVNPTWVPVLTNTLTDGWFSFSDSEWTNCHVRFYRNRLR